MYCNMAIIFQRKYLYLDILDTGIEIDMNVSLFSLAFV